MIGSTTRDDRLSTITSAGADLAVNTGNSDWVERVKQTTAGRGVDVIIDQVSGPGIADSLDAVAVKGRIINVGRLGGGHAEFDFEMHAAKQISYIGVTFRSRTPEEIRGRPADRPMPHLETACDPARSAFGWTAFSRSPTSRTRWPICNPTRLSGRSRSRSRPDPRGTTLPHSYYKVSYHRLPRARSGHSRS